jgi:hypothetical protein
MLEKVLGLSVTFIGGTADESAWDAYGGTEMPIVTLQHF